MKKQTFKIVLFVLIIDAMFLCMLCIASSKFEIRAEPFFSIVLNEY